MNEIDDLTFNTMYSVLQSGMWLLNDLESYLRPLNLSQAKLSILLAIKESADGIISPNEIAQITGKSRPAITRAIEKLSETGIVSISIDNSDGRRKRLSLTESGQKLLDKIIPEYNKRLIEMSSEFNQDEKVQIIHLLRKIKFLHKEKQLREL